MKKRAPWLTRAAFCVWIALALIGVTSLGAAHWYAFPAPDANAARLTAAVHAARMHGESSVLLHVLYAKCACSRRIFAHLRERGAQAGRAETIVLVDGDAALVASLEARGYRVLPTEASALERDYGVVAAPLLVVALADDRPLYVGGYTERKQSLELEDLRIIEALEAGGRPDFLPLFGCAVSVELQRMLDPLGLKFGAQSARVDR